MPVFEFIYAGARRHIRRMLVAAILIGLANASVLALINYAAKHTGSDTLRLLFTFSAAMLMFYHGARYLYQSMVHIVEDVLGDFKRRISDKIMRCDLQTIEQLGSTEIIDRVTESTTRITSISGQLANLLQLAVVVTFGAVYLAWLSLPALTLVAAVAGIGIVFVRSHLNDIKKHLRQAALARLRFFERLTDLIKGFKEVKLRRRRQHALRREIVGVTHETHSVSAQANILFADKYVFGRLHYFTILAAIVFLLPTYDASVAFSHPQVLAAVIFTYGPLNGVLSGLPTITRANIALEHIADLERKLDRAAPEDEYANNPWGGQFGRIELRNVEFTYDTHGTDKFHVGPINLTISRGELIFIVGGNGSGKSTLLKLLTSLYSPTSGALHVDGIPVTNACVRAYRELICAVHADFHVFQRLYGLEDINPAKLTAVLEQLRIADKTSIVNGAFRTVSLSTGQRKRLAMVVALLEDRPIYAFDEWAAEQDHDFRRYYYEELLPQLKRSGKTVLVISHDERYFHVADRIVTLNRGQLQSSTPI